MTQVKYSRPEWIPQDHWETSEDKVRKKAKEHAKETLKVRYIRT